MEAELTAQATRLDALMKTLLRRVFPVDAAEELTVTQLRVLTLLSESPCSPSCLARELGSTASAVSQIADRMERMGLVERVPEERDRRSKTVRLTRAGLAVVDERRQRRVARLSEVLARMPESRRRAVVEVLEELLEASR